MQNHHFCNPLKTHQSLIEKSFGPMCFDEKIMGENKIKNLPIILEAKLRLMFQFNIKVYVGNTPLNCCLMMMGHRQNFFLAAPKRYGKKLFRERSLFLKTMSSESIYLHFVVLSMHQCVSFDRLTKNSCNGQALYLCLSNG